MQRQFSVEINQLQEGPEFSFGDWPNKIVPHVAAGLYSIWHGSEFIYVGMSGRGLTEDHLKSLADAGARKKALYSRLDSHASGRRSGDQFCLYICDHYVVPKLSSVDLIRVGDGTISLDTLTRKFIREELTYRFVQVPNGSIALSLEGFIKASGLNGLRPKLNPS